MLRTIILVFILGILSCKSDQKIEAARPTSNNGSTPYEKAVDDPHITFKGLTIDTRFNSPRGFERQPVLENSFANYLRKLPLKTPGSDVLYFDGKTKPNKVHAAVIDLKIGTRDLHQCADAIMRLWAEHNWLQRNFDKIHFNFTNGLRVDYERWAKGDRLKIIGREFQWQALMSENYTYKTFWKYMELIFSYAGTLSLEKELKKRPASDLEIGDIFIQGGSPGHAVIIVDVAANKQGEKVFLLAQSYMPAQEMHVLINPNDEQLSPWYQLPKEGNLQTPEWTFTMENLKRFQH